VSVRRRRLALVFDKAIVADRCMSGHIKTAPSSVNALKISKIASASVPTPLCRLGLPRPAFLSEPGDGAINRQSLWIIVQRPFEERGVVINALRD